LDDIIALLDIKLKTMVKELDQFTIEEELTIKEVKRLTTNKLKEEEKIFEINKLAESSNNNPKKGTIKDNNPGMTNTKANIKSTGSKNPDININNPLIMIENEIKSAEQKLILITANIDKYKIKRDLLKENLAKFCSIDRNELKIDLVDVNGDRVNVYTKGNEYASHYLLDRQFYELHKVFYSKIFLNLTKYNR